MRERTGMNRPANGNFLPIGALITWLASVSAYGFEVGATTLFVNAGILLVGVGAVSLALRLHFRKAPHSFAIFFPATGEYRGVSQSISLMAILLIAYNIGALWVVLHSSFSPETIRLMLAAGVISAMNLADECWIARRRRLASSA